MTRFGLLFAANQPPVALPIPKRKWRSEKVMKWAYSIAMQLLLSVSVTLSITAPAMGTETVTTLPSGAISEFSGGDFGLTIGPEETLWSITGPYTLTYGEQAVISRTTASGHLTGTFQIPPFHKENFRLAGPIGLAKGANNEMWFFSAQDDEGSFVAHVSSSGVFHEIGVNGYAEAMAIDSDNNAWLTNQNGTIERVTPAGQVTPYPVVYPAPSDIGRMPSIAGAPDGKMWFTLQLFNRESEVASGAIGTISSDGFVSLQPLPFSPSPEDMTITPDGAIWFIEQSEEKLGRVGPSGLTLEFIVPNIGSSLTTGPDGNVWLTSKGPQNWIRRFTLPETITRYTPIFSTGIGPQEISVGARGDLWLTNGNYYALRVARFVVPLVPVSVEAPSISGSTVEGQVLSASPGSWINEPSTLTYQWQRCTPDDATCADLPKENGTTHALSTEDVGHTLKVTVTANNLGGTTTASSNTTPTVTAQAPITPKIITQQIFTVVPTASWKFRRHGRYTTVKLLSLNHLPSSGTILVSCSNKTCPFHHHTWKIGSSSPSRRPSNTTYHGQDMSALFRGHPLAPDTHITITVTKPDWVGKTFRFKTRPRSEPQVTITCTDPNNHRASAC